MNDGITTIRIPKSVKDELKDVANDKEPYHATISRLIAENQELKKSNRLHQHERQSFMGTIEVLTNIVKSNAH